MSDRPILFSAPMVRALLDGRKTQTRRILQPQPPNEDGWEIADQDEDGVLWLSQKGTHCAARIRAAPGDRLWVKETWRTESLAYNDLAPSEMGGEEAILYDADAAWGDNKTVGKTRVSIHMPRRASRTTLIVSDVKVERLKDITWQDAEAEGIWHSSQEYREKVCIWRDSASALQRLRIEEYGKLWDRINGAGAWESNPWVVAYTFTVIKQNIDQIEREAA